MEIDLNEDHYDYEKLLDLFSLSPQFNEGDLKQAKRKVLKLHPDKSNLSVAYYLFFRKMYLKIEEIYKYSYHAKNESELETSIDIQTHFKDYLERNNIDPKKNYDTFSKEFNKMFEKVYVSQKDEEEDGHGSWLKSEENMYDKDDLETSRKHAMSQAIIRQDEIQEMGDFKKKSLYTYDVKESLGNPFIALDVNDIYEKKPKFNSVQEFQQYIDKDDNAPLSNEQSELYLKQKEDMLNHQSKELAYQHMKTKEHMDSNYQEYIKTYLSITNK